MSTLYYSHSFVSDTATTTEQEADFPVDRIVFIVNDEADGGDTLIVAFDTYDTTDDTAIEIQAGEVLTDFPRRVGSTLKFKSDAGTVAFRALGLRE